MIVSGLSYPDLEAARDVAGWAIGNELIYSELEGIRNHTYRLRLQVRDIDGPGAKRHSRLYRLGYGNKPKKPRRSRFACGHACAALFVAYYERNPRCEIKMAQICYRDVWDFLTQYQKVLDRNIGSLMFPIRCGDECSCESDEVITDTIRPYLWDLGWPELPTPQNTQGVAV